MSFIIRSPLGYVAGLDEENCVVVESPYQKDAWRFLTFEEATYFLDDYADAGYGLMRADCTITILTTTIFQIP